MVVSIQVLRALAAMAVALVHFNQVGLMLNGHGNDRLILYPLASGVDLFFIISGFVMVHSSVRLFGQPTAPAIFMLRRIARIVPLYWISTLIALPLFAQPVSWLNFVCALAFVPTYNAVGAIAPVNGVGWTLNFEMFFYVLFATAIFWPRRVAIIVVSTALAMIVFLGSVFRPSDARLLFWSDPIVLEFAAGMGFALLYARKIRLSWPLRLILIAAGATSIACFAPHMAPSGDRVLVWGAPAGAIFAGFVFGPGARLPATAIKIAKGLGDCSYAIYLLHPLVGGAVLVLWHHGLNHHSEDLSLAIAFIAMIALAAAAFWTIERPLMIATRSYAVPPVAHRS